MKSCKNCEERHIGCHAACKKYLSEKLIYLIKKNEAKKQKYYMDLINNKRIYKGEK
jgi:hypothetical protein